MSGTVLERNYDIVAIADYIICVTYHVIVCRVET